MGPTELVVSMVFTKTAIPFPPKTQALGDDTYILPYQIFWA
jgi:hypothetical protein